MRPRDGRRRRRWVPEVVQTSRMDCGPAALKCLLEGFDIHASYGRLREACQTALDGTSIDALEEAAVKLGLDAEQVMIPPDHLMLDEARALPALAVVRRPDGNTHFVVVWSRHGRWAQVMDPGRGRRFVSARELSEDLYRHTATVPAVDWREWAASDELTSPLSTRLRALGIADPDRHIAPALEDPSWRSIAALDAAARMTESLARARAVRRGAYAAELVTRLSRRARSGTEGGAIAERYWTVRPAPAGEDGSEQLLLCGAVLLRVKDRLSAGSGEQHALSPELRAALAEPPPRPGRMLWELVRRDGALVPCLVLLATACAALSVVFQALLLQALFDLLPVLDAGWQRGAAVIFVACVAAALFALDLPSKRALLRLGRRLETRLRVALFEKLPRLGDRYFRSRLTSDMAQRSHSIHTVHLLPLYVGRAVELACVLLFTGVAIAILSPSAAWVAAIATAAAIGIPLFWQPSLAERDLRATSQSARLGVLFFDALLGLLPIRSHSADRAMATEHEIALTDWSRAARSLHRAAMWAEGVQMIVGFATAIAIVAIDTAATQSPGRSLLLAYWALSLPSLGQELALLYRRYPTLRNQVLRVIEPLGAAEDHPAIHITQGATPAPAAADRSGRGAAIDLEGVAVCASGHPIVSDVTLRIPGGAHVAVVGPSGAGKSTLLGLLLGFHRARVGLVRVAGRVLDDDTVETLRRETVWLDPEVHVWSTSLLANVLYGSGAPIPRIGSALRDAELGAVVEKLPDGLQAELGEAGALLSGGEAQRVRLARALMREAPRLVLLDEPFRGLEAPLRRELLRRARDVWRDATLLCVTHDLAETQLFDRVVVVESGRIVEDGAPAVLGADPGSRYRALLGAQRALMDDLHAAARWRRARLESGRFVEEAHAGR